MRQSLSTGAPGQTGSRARKTQERLINVCCDRVSSRCLTPNHVTVNPQPIRLQQGPIKLGKDAGTTEMQEVSPCVLLLACMQTVVGADLLVQYSALPPV
jgi:hypothetical protein